MDAELIRLDKYLSDMGVGTRKEVKKFIKAGLVSVNGEIARSPEMKVGTGEGEAEVVFDGSKIVYQKYVYLMMNKPAGYISATSDPNPEELLVVDLLPGKYYAMNPFPIGRLDRDTTGLLLLTNDGKYAHQMTSPRKNVCKTYYARVTGEYRPEYKKLFEDGIRLEDGYVCKSAGLWTIAEYAVEHADPKFYTLCRKDASKSFGEYPYAFEAIISVQEGKFHQIKRMFEALPGDCRVVYLKRIAFGDFVLPISLEEGDIKPIVPRNALL